MSKSRRRNSRHHSHVDKYQVLKKSSPVDKILLQDLLGEDQPSSRRKKKNKYTGSHMTAEQCALIAEEVFGGQVYYAHQDE